MSLIHFLRTPLGKYTFRFFFRWHSILRNLSPLLLLAVQKEFGKNKSQFGWSRLLNATFSGSFTLQKASPKRPTTKKSLPPHQESSSTLAIVAWLFWENLLILCKENSPFSRGKHFWRLMSSCEKYAEKLSLRSISFL